MSQFVSAGRGEHHCSPGWAAQDGRMVQFGLSALNGSVVRCECGTTFVAYYDPGLREGTTDLNARWRKEGRFEKWNRQRRERGGSRVNVKIRDGVEPNLERKH